MMRSKISKKSSRDFQVSSEISFLISVWKIFPTSDQIIDVTFKPKIFTNKTPPLIGNYEGAFVDKNAAFLTLR